MKTTLCFGCIIALLICMQTYSFAKIVVTPSIAVREEYNDNLFLDEEDEEYDYITTISPEINLEYSRGEALNANLNYGFDFRFYSEHNEYDDKDLRDTQHAEFQAHARPLNHFFVDITDIYRRVPVDIRSRTASGNAFLNMNESNLFTVSPYLVFPLTSTVTTRTGYAYSNLWYRSEENTDAETHSAFLTLSKKLTSKITGELKYNFYKYLPDNEDETDVIEEYDRNQGAVGLAYQMTSALLFDGEIGRAWTDYDSGDNAEFTFWNVHADYKIGAISGASLGIGYGTSLEDSSVSGTFKRRRLDVYLNREREGFTVTINPYYSVEKYLRDDRTDRVKGVSAGVSKTLSGKISLSVNGDYSRLKFLPEEENLSRYGIGGSLDYRITQKISAGLGYRYNREDTDAASGDFNNNIVWLQAKVVF